jgi:hypothetical protein
MKKKIFTLIIITGILFSCNNSNTLNTNQDSTIEKTSINGLSGSHCYSYEKNKDSVTLVISISGTTVTGKLNYNLFEKDANSGTINGMLKNDTLVADYTFTSEGTQSVREVEFLLTDSTAKEGYGEMTEKNNKMIFINPAQISFDNSFVLLKEDCSF